MSNIQYVFKPSSDKNVSPIDALNQAKLEEILWRAEPSLIAQTVKPDHSSTLVENTKPTEATITPIVASVNAKAAYQIQQERLEQTYNRIKMAIMTKAIPERKSHEGESVNNSDELIDFINAQRAWITYRNNNCHWHSTLTTDKKVISDKKTFTCLERMTRDRNHEMEQTLKQLLKQ